MFPPLPTELLHLLLKSEIAIGDFAIDATQAMATTPSFSLKPWGKMARC